MISTFPERYHNFRVLTFYGLRWEKGTTTSDLRILTLDAGERYHEPASETPPSRDGGRYHDLTSESLIPTWGKCTTTSESAGEKAKEKERKGKQYISVAYHDHPQPTDARSATPYSNSSLACCRSRSRWCTSIPGSRDQGAGGRGGATRSWVDVTLLYTFRYRPHPSLRSSPLHSGAAKKPKKGKKR